MGFFKFDLKEEMPFKKIIIFIFFLNIGNVFVSEFKSNRDKIAKLILSPEDIESIKDPLKPANKDRAITDPTKIKIAIIGAGISGLYSAILLKSIGMNFEILEANKDQIGGRAFTYYFTDKNKKSPTCKDYYDYVDMGAVRIPKNENRSVGDQPWSLVNYLRSSSNVKTKPNLIKFYYDNDNSLYYFNGISLFNTDSQDNDALGFSDSNNGGPYTGVPDYYAAKSYWEWLAYVFQPFIEIMIADYDNALNFIITYDNITVRTFMATFDGQELRSSLGLSSYTSPRHPITNERLDKEYPHIVINWLETLSGATGFYDHSLARTIIDLYDEVTTEDWVTIDGGITRLVDAMGEDLLLSKSNIRMDNKVIKIDKDKYNKLYVSTKTSGNIKKTYAYDHVISTVPLSVLQTIDTSSLNFGLKKRLAIQMITYEASVKIALKFKSRWWENPAKMDNLPIIGGQSVTDLPIRKIIYSSHGTNCSSAYGTIIVSYAWGQDATRLGSRILSKTPSQQKIMGEGELIEDILGQLTQMHGPIVRQEYINQYYAFNWNDNPLSIGAFSLYGTGQLSTLYEDMVKSEVDGYLHFAGEATSLHHATILGALNSGYRAVVEILMKEGLNDKLDQLKEKWGIPDELAYLLDPPSPP